MSVYTPYYPPYYEGPEVTGEAGALTTVYLDFTDSSGNPADPDSVQISITYGQAAGLTPIVAGPYNYSGASAPAPDVLWRYGTGLYAFTWLIPPGSAAGIYVANWICSYTGQQVAVTENLNVSGGWQAAVPPADLGYWTGSLAYTPPAGSTTQYNPVTIPFGAVDGYGIAWLWNKIEGWDGPDVQGGGVIPRSGDHGAWASPQFYAARAITLTVTASAATQGLRDLARALLQEAIPVSDLAVLTYNEPVPKQALVRRSGKITETCPTLADVQFTCGLIAPDPRKYSVAVTTATANAPDMSGATGFTWPLTFPLTPPAQPPGGSVSCVNYGTFETRPVITITGPVTGPGLVNVTTGQAVTWMGLVMGASDVLVVDFDLRQGLLNGAYRPADLGSAWWTLPPGPSTVQLTGETGAGSSITAEFQSAWI